jgi:hypothetical protein
VRARRGPHGQSARRAGATALALALALALAGLAGTAQGQAAAPAMPTADVPAQVVRDAGSGGADKGTARPGEAPGGRPVGDGASTPWAYCIDPGPPCVDDNPNSMPPLLGWIGVGVDAGEGLHAAVSAALAGVYAQAYADGLKGVTRAGSFAYAVWETDGADGGQTGTTGYTRAAGGLRGGAAAAMHAQIDAYLIALNSIGWAQFNVTIQTTSASTSYTAYTPSLAFTNREAIVDVRPGGAASAARDDPSGDAGWLLAGLGGLALPGLLWWRIRRRKPLPLYPA